MKNAQKRILDPAFVLAILERGGVVALPSQLGYALIGTTQKSVDKLYKLKGRPTSKPSGILANQDIFCTLTDSKYTKEVSKIKYPVGIIAKSNNHKLVDNLPNQVTSTGNISFFLNMDANLDKLVEYAWKKKIVITITSCNKPGQGNILSSSNIDESILKGIDYILVEDDQTLYEERKSIDQITATIIDLTNRELIRKGVFSERTLAIAKENNLIIPKAVQKKSPPFKFNSCIYMLAFKESTYDKIKYSKEVDWHVLDLEDSCPENKKPLARKLIDKYVNTDHLAGKNVAIRLNSLDDKYDLTEDLKINYTKHIKGFALPMLKDARDVNTYDKKITLLEEWLGLPKNTFKFFPIIETVQALNNAREIAKASPRNIAMFLGHADLLNDTLSSNHELNLHSIRTQYLWAAREAGIAAFDTPYPNVQNLTATEHDAKLAASIGLDGKVALNPAQLHIINKAFKIKPNEKKNIESLLEKYKGGCDIIDGKFLAPPIVKRLQKELKKGEYKTVKAKTKSVRGRGIKYGLDYRKAFRGKIVPSPYETTMDESWIMSWQAMVQTGNPLETSIEFCKEMGLNKRLIPFQCLINMGLCLAVESFSESSLFHLGISNVIYEKPAYVGDTIRSILLIDDIVPSSNRKYTVFKTRMVLLNQNDERVVSMNRNSLFPYINPEDISEGQEIDNLPLVKFFEGPKTSLRSIILQSAKTSNHWMLKQPPKFKSGELILHSICKPLGLSNSLSYSTLYKNTHPLHINSARYGLEGLVTCGGFIIPMIHAAASRDIRFALDHEVTDTMHINKIHHEDSIGAMSYIINIEAEDGIECVSIRTFGLKNIDPEKELADIEIPLELIASPKIKPSEIELVCRNYCPDLQQKICARLTWKLWRKVS